MEKCYFPRRGPLRERLSEFSHRWFEGKRCATPAGRFETEARSLDLWRKAGADVPAIFEVRPPTDHSPPTLVMEYVAGRSLFWHLVDPETSRPEAVELVSALAESCRARHAVALREREPLLIHEHATAKHVIFSGSRLVTIDLEGGYRQGYPVAVAAGWEVAGLLRSLWQTTDSPTPEHQLLRAFVRAYSDRQQLRHVATAAYGRGVVAWAKRAADGWRRTRPKHLALAGVLALDPS